MVISKTMSAHNVIYPHQLTLFNLIYLLMMQFICFPQLTSPFLFCLYLSKLALLIWCQLPIENNGSEVIFGQVLSTSNRNCISYKTPSKEAVETTYHVQLKLYPRPSIDFLLPLFFLNSKFFNLWEIHHQNPILNLPVFSSWKKSLPKLPAPSWRTATTRKGRRSQSSNKIFFKTR